jgi:4-diphosphocytidyl-2-C-methyl-D-erythritol kinase
MSLNGQRQLARAKLNLFLRVHGRRADGYHEVESLVAFAEVGDDVMVSQADEFSLVIDGPFAAPLREDKTENLVLKAARLLMSRAGEAPSPACIRLVKNLPVASGIGGGSADAAATLKALCALWQLDEDDPSLPALCKEIGADVPVCFFGRPALMSGIGDIVRPGPRLPPLWVTLVNPAVALSTQQVFLALNAAECSSSPKPLGLPAEFSDASEFAAYLAVLGNDLEGPARKIQPVIDDVLEELSDHKPILCRMSGSGATCFALFDSAVQASSAQAAIGRVHPDWWVISAPLQNNAEETRYWRRDQ